MTTTTYYDGVRKYTRTESDGSVTYNNSSRSGPAIYTGITVIDGYLTSANYTPSGVTSYNGTPVVELTADRDAIKPGGLVEDTTVDSFETRVLVDRAGRIHLFTYHIVGNTGGDPFDIRITLRLSGLGNTTVPRPGWVSRA